MKRLGRFQAQQAAADNRAHLAGFTGGNHGIQVVDGAVHKAVIAIITGDRRHERIGTGGQNHLVIRQGLTGVGGDRFSSPINRIHLGIQFQRNVVLFKKAFRHQRQVVGGLAGKVTGQPYAVIGRQRLGTQYRNIKVLPATLGHQRLQITLSDHPVADQKKLLLCHKAHPRGA